MSLLDDAFWDVLDAARGNEDAAFPILKTRLADSSRVSSKNSGGSAVGMRTTLGPEASYRAPGNAW